jgi:hypothetical protein
VTALAGRRRRATLVVGIATVAVLAVATALTVLGAVTLYNSTEGADPSTAEPDLTFPDTPTGAIAAVDAQGRLASAAIVVVQPSSRGGSIVAVPVSADASGGVGTERLPLAETVALQGTDVLAQELESTMRLQLDHVEVVTAEQLAELLEPVGDLQVDLPNDVTDASGETVAEAGAATIDAEQAAAILTARDPDVPAARQYPAAAAVWSAVATAVGDGVTADGEPVDGEPAEDGVPPVAGLGDLVERLLGGRVGYRSLRAAPPADADNPRGVDVVELDPVELTLVFGQIAPSAVAAPDAGLTFRVVSSFSDEQLAASGMTNTDVAYGALSSLEFVGANVLSVTTTGDPPGERSRIEVADQTLVPGTETADVLFGPLDVTIDERPISGVDAVLTLGTAYLDLLAGGARPTPSTVPATTPATTNPTTSSETTGD